MKKITFIFLAMLLPMMASAATSLGFTVGNVNYEPLGGVDPLVTVTGLADNNVSSVTIPSTVSYDGVTYGVRAISSDAFLNNTNLVSVDIKSGVETIAANSFAGCTNLKDISFPGTLKAIFAPAYSGEKGAFEGCTALEKIVLPASLDYQGEVDATAPHNICKWAFKNCTNLKVVVIYAKSPYIEDEAFINCSSLQYFVSYNAQPYSLESNTFKGIPSTAKLIVPDGTKSSYQALLGWDVFKNIDEHSNVDQKAILGEEDQPQGGGTAKLSIETFEMKAGETKTMLIDMQNPDDKVTLVQFDLRLPEGLSIASGDDAVDIAGRTTLKKHTLNSNAIDGITRFLLYSATNEVIEGASGAIISIKLTASSSFKGGDIKLENQLMTTPDLVESKPATYTYNLTGTENPPAGDGEPYVVYNDSTLTFYCDNQRSSRQGTKYELNEGGNSPGWSKNAENIKTVVFDASFANARPTSTYAWLGGCENLTRIQGLGYLNTSEVTNMTSMFLGCRSLTNLDLSKFNTSNVTNMNFMFSDCNSLTNLDLSNFNTGNVTTMNSMFAFCNSLTSLDVSSFNTAKVTDMYGMFIYCKSLISLDVSGFNMANVYNMGSMFANCSSLTSLDVSSFNTAKVKDMGFMFYGCSGLTNLDVSGFKTDNVTGMTSMFHSCSSLQAIYVDEDNWSTLNVTSSNNMFSGCSNLVGGNGTKYDENHIDAEYARIDKAGVPGYFTAKSGGTEPIGNKEAYAVYNDFSLTFYCDDQRSKRSGKVYSLNEGGNDPEWMIDDNNRNVEKVVFDASFANARPTTTYSWFQYCDILREIVGIENLNTSEVTNMHTMFAFCKKLESVDVTHFDTRMVGDMAAMFSNCKSLKSIDLSHFDTSSLWMMMSMFNGCNSLTEINLSSFNTSRVEIMDYLFYGCSNLRTIYLGNGFTSTNGVSCEEAFAGCQNLSKVVFTGDIPASINSAFFDGVGTANAPVKLDVPEQYTENYEAKFDGNMFYGGYFVLREAIVPNGEDGGKDYGNGNGEIDEHTDLNGSIIGNVYYNIAPANGGYNSAEGCLVVTQPSAEEAFDTEDPFGDDFKGMFTGIILMVQPGSGTVKVEAETSGSMTLMVKVGNNLPIKMTFQNKSTLAIPYSVDRTSYVYIYAGGASATRAGSENALKIYSISWESSASGISDCNADNQPFVVYSLSGTMVKKEATSLKGLPKGVYIVNGRKMVVK